MFSASDGQADPAASTGKQRDGAIVRVMPNSLTTVF